MIADKDAESNNKTSTASSGCRPEKIVMQKTPTFEDIGNARLSERENQVKSREQKTWEDFQRKHLRTVMVERRRQAEKPAEPVLQSGAPDMPGSVAAPSVTVPATSYSAAASAPAATSRSVASPAPALTAQAAAQTHHDAPTGYVAPHATVQATSANIQAAPAAAYPAAPVYTAAAAATPAVPGENKMALFSIWFSLFAAIAGAVMTTMNPSLGFADHSWIYLLGYGFLVLLIWFFGILPLAGDEVAHAKMGWLSPLFWAFVCFAWPAVGAEKICTVLANGNAIFSQLFELVIPVFVALWGIGSMWHVGAATTMDPPWPKVIGSEFKGWESGWLLLAVICTIYVNYNTYQHATDSIRLNPFVQSRADADKKLDELVATVNAQKSLDHTNNKAAVREITKVLQAFDALDKPAAGNQKKALALKNEAAALEKKGDNKGAVSKYRAAYEADPGDARNAIALAHAASSAREYDLAVKHLREALLIDPRSTEAWFALGHNYLYGHMQQPEAIAIAANYYVTGYWFSANRKTTLKHLRSQAETEPKNSPGARAARQALSKITSYQ